MGKRRQIHTQRENESIRVRKKAARHLFVAVLFSFQSFGRSYFAYYSLILHIIHISWVYVAIRVELCCQTIKPIGTKNCKLCVWDNERVCVCVTSTKSSNFKVFLWKFMRRQNECECAHISGVSWFVFSPFYLFSHFSRSQWRWLLASPYPYFVHLHLTIRDTVSFGHSLWIAQMEFIQSNLVHGIYHFTDSVW